MNGGTPYLIPWPALHPMALNHAQLGKLAAAGGIPGLHFQQPTAVTTHHHHLPLAAAAAAAAVASPQMQQQLTWALPPHAGAAGHHQMLSMGCHMSLPHTMLTQPNLITTMPKLILPSVKDSTGTLQHSGLQGTHPTGLPPGLTTGLAQGLPQGLNQSLAQGLSQGLAHLNSFPMQTKFAEKRKIIEEIAHNDVKKAKIETKALKAKRPGFTDDRYSETSYYVENGLRKVYPYYFTFTTFTKGRWVGEKILDVFAREFRAHPVEEYERCILDGTLTVNYEQVDTEYRLRHNDLLANIVHRHETPVLSKPIELIHLSEDLVVLDKPCSLPVHPCGRYRHNTVVFILAKEYNLKNLRTIHRLDRLTSGLLMFGRNPKKARELEQQIRNRQVLKEYVCRVEGEFPPGKTECTQPVEVVSYKIGVCKVSPQGKECRTEFERMNYNGKTSVVLCRPFTGRMHQIRVHLQYLGFPVMNDPLYNHTVFGKDKGKGGNIGKSDEKLIADLISIHNAENWLGMDGETETSMFNKADLADSSITELKEGCKQTHSVHHNNFDPANPIGCIENNPLVPRNCTITRPPPITRPCRAPVVLRPPLEASPLSSQDYTDELLVKNADYRYSPDKMTWDPNCYECKVRYRDPKAKDLVMYLHAWTYKGPDWQFQTRLPGWADPNWEQPENEKKY